MKEDLEGVRQKATGLETVRAQLTQQLDASNETLQEYRIRVEKLEASVAQLETDNEARTAAVADMERQKRDTEIKVGVLTLSSEVSWSKLRFAACLQE